MDDSVVIGAGVDSLSLGPQVDPEQGHVTADLLSTGGPWIDGSRRVFQGRKPE